MKLVTLKGEPISTNNCYYHGPKGLTFIKQKAKALKTDYGWQAKQQWKGKPLTGNIEVIIRLYFGTKRKSDWDNFHKLSMDALTGIVWVDDSQIQRATIEKYYDKGKGRIELEIFNLE